MTLWVAMGAIAALLLFDQLGLRALSGQDFPSTDPLAASLRAHVETLASPEWGGRKPGTDGNDQAAHYLARELSARGAAPLPSLGGYLQPVADPAHGRLGANVIGYLPPTAPAPDASPRNTILLGAHFDHLGATSDGLMLGADDNASSVAVLLGALDIIAEQRSRPAAVFIVFFNTEESPYFGTALQGSRKLLAALPSEMGDASAIRLAILLDLIGGVVWRHSSETIFACGAEKTSGLPAVVDSIHEDGLDVRRLGVHAVENLPGGVPQPFSDYDIFRARRVPFLFLSSGRTPRYHRPADLPPTLHYDRMARTSRWIARLAAAVGAAPDALRFDAGAEDFAADRDTLRWALSAATVPWKSVPGTSPITAIRLLLDLRRLREMNEPDHRHDEQDKLALERASFRLQCLLYAFPVCFTF